ncbi:hypothetical protein V8C43DRAFT_275345 [Trichoderma afarasin]
MCVRPLLLSYPLSVRCLNTGTGTQNNRKTWSRTVRLPYLELLSLHFLLRHKSIYFSNIPGQKLEDPQRGSPRTHQNSCKKQGV